MDDSAVGRRLKALVVTDGDDFDDLGRLMDAFGIDAERVSWSEASDPREAPAISVVHAGGVDEIQAEGIVRNLRRDGSRVLVQAADATGDRVRAFYEAGADVVFNGPADAHHLSLQCCALLQVWQTDSRPVLVGRARFDAANRRLLVDEGSVRLTEAETKILGMLVDGRGGFVSRDAISRSVFHIPYDRFDRRIDVHVSNLRRKLRENDVGAAVDTSRLNGLRLAGSTANDAVTPADEPKPALSEVAK